MRRFLFLLALLLLPTAFALNVTLTTDGPATLLPGETGTYTISAAIDGVPIISFPATATLTFPDGSVATLPLTNTLQGTYTASIYSVSEGTHALSIRVPLGEETFEKTVQVRVQKPAAAITIDAHVEESTLVGTITQDQAGDFSVEVTPFSTGDLTTKQYTAVCTVSCGTSCTFSCPLTQQTGIARFSTKRAYTYNEYVPFGTPSTVQALYDTVTGVNEPLELNVSVPAEVYVRDGNILSQIPLTGSVYTFTPVYEGTYSILVHDGNNLQTLPLQVITRENVQVFAPVLATDSTTSWWYGFVSTNKEILLRLPSDPGLHEAYFLSDNTRSTLDWEKGYVKVPAGTGWVEVKRAQLPQTVAVPATTEYGMLVGGVGWQRHEFNGEIAVFDSALSKQTTYRNGSTSVFYTHDEQAAVVLDTTGSIQLPSPLLVDSTRLIDYDVSTGERTGTVDLSIYTFEGTLMQRVTLNALSGTYDLAFHFPVGKYLAVARGATTAATGFFLFSTEPSLLFGGTQEIITKENTVQVLTQTITNNDLQKTRVVELTATSKFTAIINATDTNSNGVVDITLAPGETTSVSSTVYIPPGAVSDTISFTAQSDELNATVTHTITIEQISSPIYSDADVVSIQGTVEQPLAYIQNNNDATIIGTLYVHGPQLTTQLSVTLQPGMNNVTVPTAGSPLTVRLQAVGDTLLNNNERTRDFRQMNSTRLVHINERLHIDHETYTVQLPTVPNFVLQWYDEQGAHDATAMIEGEKTLWNIGTVPANKEFYAALVPGEPIHENLALLIDNSNPAVTKKGSWVATSGTPGYIGFDYLIDLNIDKTAAVIYAPNVHNGLYSISIYTPPDKSFASNVPVIIYGVETNRVQLNEKKGGWSYLGLYELNPNSSVVIENAKTTQFVVADAISLTPFSQIGGLEFVGNSTIELTARPGQEISFSALAYLEGVTGIDAPAGMQAHSTTTTVTLQAKDVGEYIVHAYDGEHTLTILLHVEQPFIYTSTGQEVTARVTLKKNGKLVQENMPPGQVKKLDEEYEITIGFDNAPIESLTVHNAKPKDIHIGLERVANERAQQFTPRHVVDAIGINPGFNSSYTYTKIAVGRELLKCTAYDFATQNCTGPFVHVRDIEPGESYSVTLTPEDPLIVEASDSIIAPREATCSSSATYLTGNCLGTYDNTPTCANERVWCDDSVTVESWTGNRNAQMGINASYGDTTRDIVDDCNKIKDVVVVYDVWEAGDLGLTYNLYVDADNNGWTQVRTNIAVPDAEAAAVTFNVTASLPGGETWDCADFFGTNPTARLRIEAGRGGSGPVANSYTFNVDYLVYRLDYNYTQRAVETDASSYTQGDTVNITGDDLWSGNANVSINVTKSSVYVTQINVTANGSGYFTNNYTLGDYQAIGVYDLYAWQQNNTAFNATNNFTVTARTPTIATNRTGDYFNRSETAIFSGTKWAKSANVTAYLTDPDGNAYSTTYSNNTNSSGGLTIYWQIPSSLDTLLGNYSFSFREIANTTYNVTKNVPLVLLPYGATNDLSADQLNAITKLDSSYATFIDDKAPTSTEYINLTYPAVMLPGTSLNSAVATFYHQEGATASNIYVQYFNVTSAAWVTICTKAIRTTPGWDTCDITSAVNVSNNMNNISLRYSDAGTDAWPSTPTYSIDIAYLNVTFAFPSPNTTQISPANNSWFSSASQQVTFNSSDSFFTIRDCRLYVNTVFVQTNNSYVVNNTGSFVHTFSEGNNSWYVQCFQNSSRNLSGTSGTRYILIDLTRPFSNITTPAANATWFNVSQPNITFLPYDNMASTMNFTVYINSTGINTSIANNNTAINYIFPAQAEGLKTTIVEVWDQAYNYAINQTKTFYVDRTAPSVTLNTPATNYNTSSTTITFNWTYTDALSSTASCGVYINNTLNTTVTSSNNTPSTTNVSGLSIGVNNWTVYCTDLAGNRVTTTEVRNFTIDTAAPTVTLVSPVNNTVFNSGRNVTLFYSTSDAITGPNSCQLYVNGVANSTSTGIANATTYNFNLTNLTNNAYNWSVNCTDYAGNMGVSEGRTFNMTIRVDALSPAANTRVDRDGVDATDPDVVLLVANLTSNESNVNITFKANLTSPPITGQTNILLGSNTTNNTGQTALSFNPSSTLYAGNYTWWVEESSSVPGTNRSLHVYGGLYVPYNSLTLDPLTSYNLSQVVKVAYNLSSFGPENSSVLNTTYGTNVSVNLTQPNGTNTTITARYNFTAWNASATLATDAEIGLWNASAETGANWFYSARNTSRSFNVYSLSNAVSPANDTAVDRDGVDVSDLDSISLIVFIPGAYQSTTVNFTANLTNPVVAGQTNLLLGTNTTNASGHSTLYFNPNSTHYAGNYVWFGITNSTTVNTTASFIVKGGLNSTYNSSLRPNSTYTLNDTAIIELNVSSLAIETMSELNSTYGIVVNNTVTNTSGSTNTTQLIYRNQPWNGSHTLTTLKGVGVWNTSAQAGGTYWYLNTTNRTISVYSYMNVTNNSQSTTTIYAYDYFIDFCRVQDQHTQYDIQSINVTFYTDGIYVGSNTTNSSGFTSFRQSINTTGSHTLTCNVTDQVSAYYYRGNVPELNATVTVLPVPLTPAAPANDTVLDRDSFDASDLDSTILNLTVPASMPDGITIQFIANITAPSIGQTDILLGSNTTSGGNVISYFNPNSTHYAGNWTWYGNASQTITNGTSRFIVKGSYSLAHSDATYNPNSTYNITDTITTEVNLTSAGPESATILNQSYSATVDSTFYNASSGNSTVGMVFNGSLWRNNTFNPLGLKVIGNWSNNITSSASYFYTPANISRNTNITSYMNITENSTSAATITAFGYTTTNCRVQDQFTAYDVPNANVTFYRNGTYIGSNLTNSSGHAQFGFQITTTGTHTITCNVTNQPSIFYYRGSAPEGNSSVTVIPFGIAAVSPANDTVVDRDSANSIDPDTILLNVSVSVGVPDGQTITFTANLTAPGIAGQNDIVLGTNTTSNGYASFYYNPNATSYAGNWSWFGAHTDGLANSTNTYISKGSYAQAFSDSVLNPNSTYNITGIITAHVNITSNGPESISELNQSYSPYVNITFYNTTLGNSTVPAHFNGSLWRNNTFSPLTLYSAGSWNITASSSFAYMYSAVNTTRNTNITSFMNITENSTSSATISAFSYTMTTCRVQDQYTQYDVTNANVTFYRDGTYVGSNLTNSSGNARLWHQINTTGTYVITCNVTYQPEINYYRGSAPEGNSTVTVTPFSIGIISPANNSIVDRDGANTIDPDTIILNVSVDANVPDGQTINFTANLTDPSFGYTNIVLGSNTTLGGYAMLYYDANATSYAGNWTWFGVHDAGLANSTNYYFSKGSYNQTFSDITRNPNSTYNITDTITTEVNISSNGPESIAQLNTSYAQSVNVTFYNTTLGNTTLGLVFNGSLWRNNTFSPLTIYSAGMWNATVTSAFTYMYSPPNSTRNVNITSFMNVTENTTSSATITAFDYTTTTCRVQDQYTQYNIVNANVTFYRNGTYIGSNLTATTGYAVLTHQIAVPGGYIITCNVTSQPNIFYYRGSAPEGNSSVTVIPFGIATVSPANGTTVDRDGVNSIDPDTILLNVSVDTNVPDGETITFTANLTAPSIAGQTDFILGSNTTLGGYAALYYDPNATTYAGNWTWFGTHTAGLANTTNNYITKGSYNQVFSDITLNPNSSYNLTDTITTNINISSNGPETIAELNQSYAPYVNITYYNTTLGNSTVAALFNGSHWRNNTFSPLTLKAVGIWNVSVVSAFDYMYSATNSTRNTNITSSMNITANTTSPASITVFQYTTTACTVQDQNTQYNVANANVTFYRGGVYIGSNLTDSDGQAVFSYQVVTNGTYTITCNVTDQPNIFYYRGNVPEGNSTLVVAPFSIGAVSPTNDSIIDRDSYSVVDADTLLLNVSVDSFIPDGQTIEFRANLTDPSIGQTNIVLGSNTTLGGYAMLYYDANATSYAGNWTWFGTHATALANSTLRFVSKGSVSFAFESATADPNENYTQNETALMNVTVISGGPETAAQLNNTYTAVVNATLDTPTASQEIRNLTYDTAHWNGTKDFLAPLAEVGIWNITPYAGLNYFYTPSSISRNTTVYGYANITAISVSSPIDSYASALYSCTVQNHHTGAAVENMTVYFYQDATYLGSNLTNSSGQAVFTRQENFTGIFTTLCNITTDLSVYYYAGPQANITTSLNVTPILLTPSAPANDTQIDRDELGHGSATAVLSGRVRTAVPDGISFEFWANLTDPPRTGQAIYLGSNVTNGSYVNLTFNPNSTFYAGNYTWWMNSTGGVPNGTARVLIIGSTNVTYSTTTYPNGSYNQSDSVLLIMNISSLGPENLTELNSTYALVANTTLTPPSGWTVNLTTAFNGTQWNSSYNLPSNASLGVWNTSVNTTASYFYTIMHVLRNFTVYELANVITWDAEEEYNGTVFAGADGHYFASYTNSSGGYIGGATCTLTTINGAYTMTDNPVTGRYEFTNVLWIEGKVRYNVSCAGAFSNVASNNSNVSVHSSVNVSAETSIVERAAGVREVLINVTNYRNYTENDIYVTHFMPADMTVQYATTPVNTQYVNGAFIGNSTLWYIGNIGSNSSTLIRYNVSGTTNVSGLFETALKVYTENTSLTYG
jgi:hypothetical protein